MVLGAVRLSLLSVIRDNWRDRGAYYPSGTQNPGSQWRLLAWLLAASSSHTGARRVVGMLWPCRAGCSRQGHCLIACEGMKARDPLLLFLYLDLLYRKKRHWLSVTSSQAMRGLFFGMYLSCPGNLDMFLKEVFFLSILHWSSLEVGNFQFSVTESELVLAASGSELLVCCAWLASCYYLRIVWWAAMKWVPLA